MASERGRKVLLAAAALAAAAALWSIQRYGAELRSENAETLRRLRIVAGAEKFAVENWLADTRLDLNLCLDARASSGRKIDAYRRYLRREGLDWLVYVDRSGRTIEGVYGAGRKAGPGPATVAEALRRGFSVRFFRQAGDARAAIELAQADPAGTQAGGVLVARVDPRQEFLRDFWTDHAFSASAETVLVRREEAFIEYLYGARGAGTPGPMPLSSPNLLAAKLLRGEALTGQEVDYRGQPVLAAASPIAATNWLLVLKVDAREVAAPIRARALWRAAGSVLLVALAAAAALAFLRRAELEGARRELDAQRDRSRLLDAFFEHAVAPLVLLDKHFNFLRVNGAYAQACAKKIADFPGHNHFEYYPHAENEAIFRNVVRAKTFFRAVAKPFTFPDHPEWGTTYWDWTLVPLLDAEGEVEALIFSLVDVTESVRSRAELEDRVKVRTAQLERANKELEAFAYSVSHDLRAPLRAVDGFSQILVEDHGPKLDAECRRLLGVVRQSAVQMGTLIDDLLSFSRMSRQALARAPADMRRIVEEALAASAGQRGGRRVRLEIGELSSCEGDAALLKQVWVNLIGNALKFTRARAEAHIQIGSAARGSETVYWIKDNGVGFDMRYADKLFKVFQRLHSTQEFEGTGIGLAIVARIVERHGGRIWAEAEPGRGAKFFFTLGGTDL